MKHIAVENYVALNKLIAFQLTSYLLHHMIPYYNNITLKHFPHIPEPKMNRWTAGWL